MSDEEFAVLRERCALNAAQRDAAVSCLKELLATIDRRAMASHQTQLLIWRATALVEELGK